MTDAVNTNRIINNSDLVNVSKALVGVTEKNNQSVFKAAEKLDSNKNKELETNETVVSKLLSLGDSVILGIAKMLNISIGKDSSDNAKDNILDDYFKPFAENTGKEIEKTKNPTIQMSAEVLSNTLKSIIQDKQSKGIEIKNQTRESGDYNYRAGESKIEENGKKGKFIDLRYNTSGNKNKSVIEFTDGTSLVIMKDANNESSSTKYVLSYTSNDEKKHGKMTYREDENTKIQ